MGAGYTKEDEDLFVSELYSLAQSSGILPDIDIDQSLRNYSGLDSADVLQSYTSTLESDVLNKAPDYVTNLGSAIASLNAVPNAVGLGALVISFILDLAIKSVAGNNKDSTLNMIRRVFAEEKASSVRDTMEECMKRLSMHVRDPSKALVEIERIEKQLSDQLTRLKNSMIHDNQMSSRSMRYWVNGAAFHSQMLIHEARLKAQINGKDSGNQVGTINTVIDLYQHDLQQLLKKYKTYKHSTIKLYRDFLGCAKYTCYYRCVIIERELNRNAEAHGGTFSNDDYEKKYCEYVLDAYVNYMFNTWGQVKKLEEYFSDLKKNIEELIQQHQKFTMKNS